MKSVYFFKSTQLEKCKKLKKFSQIYYFGQTGLVPRKAGLIYG